MPDRLIDDPDGVAALAATVAEHVGVPADHVEKDFWVTEVLRGVVGAATDAGVEVVFKGGTSLSKAFALIRRFSEDVDVLVVLPPADSKRACDRHLKALVGGAEAATGLTSVTVAGATSAGTKRGARFHYRPSGLSGSGLSDGVFLELGSRGGGLPSTRTSVSSLLAIHAAAQLAAFPEAQPVEVRVMAPWRTLVEKLVLLHTAHQAVEPAIAIKGARHYYDIHQLLARPEITAGIHEHGIALLARDVCTYSAAAAMPAAYRPTGGFAESPAFTDSPYLGAVRAAYQSQVVAQLVWPGELAPTFDDCLAAIQRHRDEL
jgi:hypothetical protein